MLSGVSSTICILWSLGEDGIDVKKLFNHIRVSSALKMAEKEGRGGGG